jgi:hypothetical protein
MKNFGKIFFFLVAVACSNSLFSQAFGLRGGLNLANMTFNSDSDDSDDFDTDMLIGLNLGVAASFEVSSGLMFETGLGLSQKGFKVSEDDATVTWRANYLDIPLTLKKMFAGDKVFVQAGPYLGFGISGKSKYKFDGKTEDEPIDWGSDKDDDDQKRLDFGLTFGAGAMVTDKIQVGLNYGLGLANVSPYSENGYKETNQVIGITVGYSLAK